MDKVTAQDAQAYIEAEGYLSQQALADRAGTTAERIGALEGAQCIPAASYVVAGAMTYTSSFGSYALPAEPRRYYHRSTLGWVKKAMRLAENHDLAEVAGIVRTDFDRAFDAALNGTESPWPGGADYAWNFVTDGTWGLCLKDVTIANLLTKERARATIRRIVRPEPDHTLSAGERAELECALRNYDKVALPFAPHEFAESSRHNEFQPAIEKYGMAEPSPVETAFGPKLENRESQASCQA